MEGLHVRAGCVRERHRYHGRLGNAACALRARRAVPAAYARAARVRLRPRGGADPGWSTTRTGLGECRQCRKHRRRCALGGGVCLRARGSRVIPARRRPRAALAAALVPASTPELALVHRGQIAMGPGAAGLPALAQPHRARGVALHPRGQPDAETIAICSRNVGMIRDGWGSKISGIALDPRQSPDYRNGPATHSLSSTLGATPGCESRGRRYALK